MFEFARSLGDTILENVGRAAGRVQERTPLPADLLESDDAYLVVFDAPGAEAVMILAMGNPTPGVAEFKFGPLAATQSASTRIRLAGTQDVVAVARMKDGSFAKASKNVKVTIGGCGG